MFKCPLLSGWKVDPSDEPAAYFSKPPEILATRAAFTVHTVKFTTLSSLIIFPSNNLLKNIIDNTTTTQQSWELRIWALFGCAQVGALFSHRASS